MDLASRAVSLSHMTCRAQRIKSTYNWECDGAVCEEVVVNGREVRSAANNKLECGLDLDEQRTISLDGINDLLLLLLDLVALCVQVLDDLSWAIEGGEGGDVVERRLLS